jgi:hypothetical protein
MTQTCQKSFFLQADFWTVFEHCDRVTLQIIYDEDEINVRILFPSHGSSYERNSKVTQS